MAFILNTLIMKNITFAEKNNLIVKHQGKKHFYKDLELFKKHFPSHGLNTELANANQFSIERLDGQMLNELLGVVDIKEIIENRKDKDLELTPEPPGVKTIDDVISLLIEQCNLTVDNIRQIGEDYLQYLTTKDDEAIKAAIGKFVAFQPVQDDDKGTESDTQDDESGDSTSIGDDQGKTVPVAGKEEISQSGCENMPPVQLAQRDNVKVFQQRIADANTIEAVEAILKEDKEGGERSTVQKAGLNRIEVLKLASQDNADGKKKD